MTKIDDLSQQWPERRKSRVVQFVTDTGVALVQAGRDFIAGFTPPDYLIDLILRRGNSYTFTGRTGDGKTAVMLRIMAHVLLGLVLGKYFVERGRVLYLAGENPDDIRMRWMAMAHEMDFDPCIDGAHFIEGRFSIEGLFQRVAKEIQAIGGVDLVMVDTSATYFELENENDNAQMAAHARMMRSLTSLPGRPAVLVACHPTKNASDDNMLPRGGGAFLAEVDGNLTGIKRDSVVEVHWQGKFRGCEFAPLSFQLMKATAPNLIDSKGRTIPTVMARPITENIKEEIEGEALNDQDQVLILMHMTPGKSLAGIAEALSWFFDNGDPNKPRAQRAVNQLRRDKLVRIERGKWVLTEDGKKEAKKLAP